MAASDRFDITVEGKGGHGGMPAGTVDAIVEAASLVSSLQTITSRNLDPFETGVNVYVYVYVYECMNVACVYRCVCMPNTHKYLSI